MLKRKERKISRLSNRGERIVTNGPTDLFNICIRPRISLSQAAIGATFGNELLHQVGISPISIWEGVGITPKIYDPEALTGNEINLRENVIRVEALSNLTGVSISNCPTVVEAFHKTIKLDDGFTQAEAILLLKNDLKNVPLTLAIVKLNTIVDLADRFAKCKEDPHNWQLALKICDYVNKNYTYISKLQFQGATEYEKQGIVTWRTKLCSTIITTDKTATNNINTWVERPDADQVLRKDPVFVSPEQLSYAGIKPEEYASYGVRTCNNALIEEYEQDYRLQKVLQNNLILHIGAMHITDKVYNAETVQNLLGEITLQIAAKQDLSESQKENLLYSLTGAIEDSLQGHQPFQMANNLYAHLGKGVIGAEQYTKFISPFLTRISNSAVNVPVTIATSEKKIIASLVDELCLVIKHSDLKQKFEPEFKDSLRKNIQTEQKAIETWRIVWSAPFRVLEETIKIPFKIYNYFAGNGYAIPPIESREWTSEKRLDVTHAKYPTADALSIIPQEVIAEVREEMLNLVKKTPEQNEKISKEAAEEDEVRLKRKEKIKLVSNNNNKQVNPFVEQPNTEQKEQVNPFVEQPNTEQTFKEELRQAEERVYEAIVAVKEPEEEMLNLRQAEERGIILQNREEVTNFGSKLEDIKVLVEALDPNPATAPVNIWEDGGSDEEAAAQSKERFYKLYPHMRPVSIQEQLAGLAGIVEWTVKKGKFLEEQTELTVKQSFWLTHNKITKIQTVMIKGQTMDIHVRNPDNSKYKTMDEIKAELGMPPNAPIRDFVEKYMFTWNGTHSYAPSPNIEEAVNKQVKNENVVHKIIHAFTAPVGKDFHHIFNLPNETKIEKGFEKATEANSKITLWERTALLFGYPGQTGLAIQKWIAAYFTTKNMIIGFGVVCTTSFLMYKWGASKVFTRFSIVISTYKAAKKGDWLGALEILAAAPTAPTQNETPVTVPKESPAPKETVAPVLSEKTKRPIFFNNTPISNLSYSISNGQTSNRLFKPFSIYSSKKTTGIFTKFKK